MNKEEIMILLGKLSFMLNRTELLTDVTDALNELLEYKQIDNANPSEALTEIFNIIYNLDCGTTFEQDKKLNECRDVLKRVIFNAEKEHKALEIIKEKKVNILLLELAENVDEYNERIVPNGQLTQEEYETIKEVLE